MLLEELVGWIGTLLSMPIFISPIVPFMNVFNKKLNYQDAPNTLISTRYFNCLIWYIYGKLINSPQIKISNIIGCCISLLFIIIYLSYEIRKNTMDTILNTLLVLSTTWIIYRAFTKVMFLSYIIGYFCIFSSMILLISPLHLIYKVLREKNYLLIPVFIAIFSILRSVCWVFYGLMKKNYYIVGTSSGEVIIGIVQIALRYNLKQEYHEIEKGSETLNIGIEDNNDDEKKLVDVKEKEEDIGKSTDIKVIV